MRTCTIRSVSGTRTWQLTATWLGFATSLESRDWSAVLAHAYTQIRFPATLSLRNGSILVRLIPLMKATPMPNVCAKLSAAFTMNSMVLILCAWCLPTSMGHLTTMLKTEAMSCQRLSGEHISFPCEATNVLMSLVPVNR